jgi:hypothetical protein
VSPPRADFRGQYCANASSGYAVRTIVDNLTSLTRTQHVFPREAKSRCSCTGFIFAFPSARLQVWRFFISSDSPCQVGGIFRKISRNQGLNPGEGASPDSFFPSFRPAVAQSTNREKRKGLLHENENFSHNKFSEPLVPPTREGRRPSYSARARLLCAVADSASGVSRRLRRQQLQHVPG